MWTLFFSVIVYLLACKMFSNDNKKQRVQISQRTKGFPSQQNPWVSGRNRYSRVSSASVTPDTSYPVEDRS